MVKLCNSNACACSCNRVWFVYRGSSVKNWSARGQNQVTAMHTEQSYEFPNKVSECFVPHRKSDLYFRELMRIKKCFFGNLKLQKLLQSNSSINNIMFIGP